MKNRDQGTLVALQTQLREQTKSEFDRRFAALNARTVAQMKAHDRALQSGLVAQLGQVAVPGGGASHPVSLPSDMRARLEALHKKYQDDFNKDAGKTVADFQKTRNDLTERFRRLEGIDAGAQDGTNRQLDALQKQRGDLYNEMVDEINREVRLIAEKRGVNVVFSSIIAPAGGVDLTEDAEKDIESLHE
jgi:Skp family chaperone for outer membrane proteins